MLTEKMCNCQCEAAQDCLAQTVSVGRCFKADFYAVVIKSNSCLFRSDQQICCSGGKTHYAMLCNDVCLKEPGSKTLLIPIVFVLDDCDQDQSQTKYIQCSSFNQVQLGMSVEYHERVLLSQKKYVTFDVEDKTLKLSVSSFKGVFNSEKL